MYQRFLSHVHNSYTTDFDCLKLHILRERKYYFEVLLVIKVDLPFILRPSVSGTVVFDLLHGNPETCLRSMLAPSARSTSSANITEEDTNAFKVTFYF